MIIVVLLGVCGCGDAIGQTDVLTFRWGSSSSELCSDGNDVDDLDAPQVLADLAVREAEVMHWAVESEPDGPGEFNVQDFGLAVPDENTPFLSIDEAQCSTSFLPLAQPDVANRCLDRMRVLVSDRSQSPYTELIDALNNQAGLEVRGTKDCGGGDVGLSWRMEMRIWTRRTL